MNNTLPTLFPPFPHIRNVNQAAVRHRLHGLALTTGTAMHTGRYLHLTDRKMMLGVEHRTRFIGQQRAVI